MIDKENPQPGSFAHDHPAQSEMLKGLTALYLEVPKEIADDVFKLVNAGVAEAINDERKACADIALAVGSGRGNEKEIARVIEARGQVEPGGE